MSRSTIFTTATPAQGFTTIPVTASSTSTATVTPTNPASTITVSVTQTGSTTSVCSISTVTSSQLSTQINYSNRPSVVKRDVEKRYATTIPSELSGNCGSGQALSSKISSACSCYLGACKTTVTKTATVKTTVTAPSNGVRSSNLSYETLS